MNVERKQIRDLVARALDVEDCADEVLGYIERGAPAVHYFFLRKAAGRCSSTGRGASIDFLRTLPESFFDYLLKRALTLFRRPERSVEALRARDPELTMLAFALWLDDEHLERCCNVPDEGLSEIIFRFMSLILLEEEQRAGASVWLTHHPMLLRDGAVAPLQFPVMEWLTPN